MRATAGVLGSLGFGYDTGVDGVFCFFLSIFKFLPFSFRHILLFQLSVLLPFTFLSSYTEQCGSEDGPTPVPHTRHTMHTILYGRSTHTRTQKRQKATNTHNETTSKANVVMTTITTRTEICKSLERPSFLFDEISFLFPLAQFLLQHSKPSRYLFLMNLNPFRYPLFCFFSIASCFYVLLTSFVIASCFSFCL